VEHIAGQALGMDTNQRRGICGDVAHFESYRLLNFALDAALETVNAEEAKLRWEIGFRRLPDSKRG
jgi:hypothetical protein